MKLKPLNIFGQEIKVEIEDLSANGFAGQYDFDNKKISIDTNCKEKLATYFHECLHGCWYRLGIHQTKIPHEVHEIVVEGFSRFLEENFEQILHARKQFLKESKKRK